MRTTPPAYGLLHLEFPFFVDFLIIVIAVVIKHVDAFVSMACFYVSIERVC